MGDLDSNNKWTSKERPSARMGRTWHMSSDACLHSGSECSHTATSVANVSEIEAYRLRH